MDKAQEVLGMGKSPEPIQKGKKDMCHDTPGQLYPVKLVAPRPKEKTDGDKLAANYSDF